MYALTRSGGWLLATMPYGVQTGGFEWVTTPSFGDLQNIVAWVTVQRYDVDSNKVGVPSDGWLTYDYYAETKKGWMPVTEEIARAARGHKKGFPRSIVCIKIQKL